MSDLHFRKHRQILRKSFACDECKRRKVRCSGDEKCSNCVRDAKQCQYSTPSQKLASLQRRLHESESTRQAMERAWSTHLPSVNLQEAIRSSSEAPQTPSMESPSLKQRGSVLSNNPETELPTEQQQPPTSVAEHSNAEDFEFDESQDFDSSIDGMEFLTVDPHKAGYTGPQSGIAALKFLQALPLRMPLKPTASPSSWDEANIADASSQSAAHIQRFMDNYFSIHHTAYPILHEGTFRARVSGALAKPRDGSWPLLYNTVLAIGAFVGDTNATRCDLPFYKEARKHLSMDVLEKGSLSYVQAIILFANYLQKRNKPNAGFVLIGIGFSMALAIGLHREFGMPSTSPFTMEIRRRVWWTLYIYVSGAQLTLGRPAVSLVGVNVRLPLNVDDHDLAVDMEELPEPRTGATITSCLIAQVQLAKIANVVQTELLTHQLPTYEKVIKLNQNIDTWWKDLPPHFGEDIYLEMRLEIPKRILLWRSFHLRIVLNRPFLFRAIATKSPLTPFEGPVGTCITAASECVESVCSFLEAIDIRTRGLAWYATYWLITASFVQSTCNLYDASHQLAPTWRADIRRAIECLGSLGAAHETALRAQSVLQSLLDQDREISPGFTAPSPATSMTRPFSTFGEGMGYYGQIPLDQRGSSNAELVDAAGGFMIQSFFDVPEDWFPTDPWMPG